MILDLPDEHLTGIPAERRTYPLKLPVRIDDHPGVEPHPEPWVGVGGDMALHVCQADDGEVRASLARAEVGFPTALGCRDDPEAVGAFDDAGCERLTVRRSVHRVATEHVYVHV